MKQGLIATRSAFGRTSAEEWERKSARRAILTKKYAGCAFGKAERPYKKCAPESKADLGIMVAVPEYGELNEEFENPTPLSLEKTWRLRTIMPCRVGERKRSMTELLFYMLRSGADNNNSKMGGNNVARGILQSTYDMLDEEQPMETFRQRVRHRLEVGKTYKFWVTVHSEVPHHTKERKRVQKKMTVVAFYPNVVHLRRKNGISECFGYHEVWRMLCREDGQGDI